MELEEQPGAGMPDGWQRIWMPERMAYIKGEGKDGCPFCDIPSMDDESGLIVARGDNVYAVLNLYPYNSGHLMVVPFRHVADYTELGDSETAELASYTKQAMAVLREVSGAQGFNIGMNQGSVAGAGIAPHLHQHVSSRARRCCPSCSASPGSCWQQHGPAKTCLWSRREPCGRRWSAWARAADTSG
jgi:ATP adenylyltransferase